MFGKYWQGESINFVIPPFLWWLLPFAVLDIILKAFALWRVAKKGQVLWFVALLLVNSLGILPGFYLLLTQPRQSSKKSA